MPFFTTVISTFAPRTSSYSSASLEREELDCLLNIDFDLSTYGDVGISYTFPFGDVAALGLLLGGGELRDPG